MLRLALVLHLALGAPCLELAAQDVVPDTTDPGSYFPYTVGSEWQYEGTDETGELFFERREIVKRVQEGRGQGFDFVLRLISQAGEGDRVWQEVQRDTITYDGYHGYAAGYQTTANGSQTYPLTCLLASAFGEEQVCYADGTQVVVEGGYEEEVTLAEGQSVAVPARKGFRPTATEAPYNVYAAGIGLVFRERLASPESFRLAYARIVAADGSVRTVGSEVFVASETERPGACRDVRAFPSPTSGPVTVVWDAADASGMEIEIVDGLGRRLVGRSVRSQRHTFDASAWAPGLYLVRVTCGEHTVTTPVLRL